MSARDAPQKNVCGCVMPRRQTCGLLISTGISSFSRCGALCLPFQQQFAELQICSRLGLSERRAEPLPTSFTALKKPKTLTKV